MRKSEMINEIMGVPRVLDFWVDKITSIVILGIDQLIEQDSWSKRSGDIDGELMTIYTANRVFSGTESLDEIIKLNDVTNLNELVNKKEFQEFPLYKPEIKIETTIMDDIDYDNFIDNINIEALHTYDIDRIKISKLGKNKVYVGNIFKFNIVVPKRYVDGDQTSKKDLYNKLIPVVSHELLHSYQQYQQLKKKEKPGFGKETILNIVPSNLNIEGINSWNEFVHTVYLHLSFEVNARVTQLYYDMKNRGIKTKEEALIYLKNSDVWSDYRMLSNFNSDEFIREFNNELSDDTGYYLRSLIDTWDVVLQSTFDHLKHKIDIDKMDPVPERAKNDPKVFFDFFEKRFHRKAEVFKRKLGKVITSIIDDSDLKP